jgi:hypothetical protein
LVKNTLLKAQGSIRDVFASMDTSGSGSITTAQFAAGMELYGIAVNAEQQAMLFALIDADESGTLEFDELEGWMKAGDAPGGAGGFVTSSSAVTGGFDGKPEVKLRPSERAAASRTTYTYTPIEQSTTSGGAGGLGLTSTQKWTSKGLVTLRPAAAQSVNVPGLSNYKAFGSNS